MLFANNEFNIELMNLFLIGPLFIYIGTKKTYSDPRVSTIFLTLLLITPFIV